MPPPITREEALRLGEIEDRAQIEALVERAGTARMERSCDSTDMCSLVNAKSGGCAEDGGFWAQSRFADADPPMHAMFGRAVAQHRLAMLASACALAAVAYLPASSALGASRSHRAGHRPARHGARKHGGARCAATGGRQSGARRHARRASYRTGALPPHLRRAFSCAHRPVLRLTGRQGPPHGPAAAHSSACVDANLTPTAGDLDRIRAATLCLVNRERAGQGESALTSNPRLACAAQAHSDDMASADYYEHVGPGGDTPESRMRACGYLANPNAGYEIGENIALGGVWLATPRAIVTAWMASPEHRANILDARYRDTAIGVSARPPVSLADGEAGAMYTQDFGVIIAG